MKKIGLSFVGIWALVSFGAGAAAYDASVAVGTFVENDIAGVKLRGETGARFDAMLRNQVLGTDVDYLTECFKTRCEPVGGWRSEFWGKFMHSAAPFAASTGCPKLREKVLKSTRAVMATQQADGYIGSYAEGTRSNKGWDIWGNKYTLLGLLHAYDLTGDREFLASARRLADYLIGIFGPDKRSLRKTGNWVGQASGSVLEPIVWLYNRTKDPKYLAFAKWIVSELDAPDGARLLRDADVKPVDRPHTAGTSVGDTRKAYEMMSCYQGILEYAQATDDAKLVETVARVAKLIAATEITITGGAGSMELWYGGRENQVRRFPNLQETCVTTTWMRLCEKLLALTGDSFWADELERSFYNAYLGALRADGSEFSAYTPLVGTRSKGHYHCDMQTDCCNANGPRGFLAYLRTYFMSAPDDTVVMNGYGLAQASAKLSSGGEAAFDTFTLYPSAARLYPEYGHVRMTNVTAGERTFTLKLRIPAWSKATKVEVGGKPVEGVVAGSYLAVRRLWKPGDLVQIWFDFSCRPHVIGDYVAFTAGPLVLARDSRYRDGDLGETLGVWGVAPLRKGEPADGHAVTVSIPGVWTEYAVKLPLGDHWENPERSLGRTVRFCDYASAGNSWDPKGFSAVWLPLSVGMNW